MNNKHAACHARKVYGNGPERTVHANQIFYSEKSNLKCRLLSPLPLWPLLISGLGCVLFRMAL